nr:MAG TPA: hypothetical protein [Caudoviricetes sp.]
MRILGSFNQKNGYIEDDFWARKTKNRYVLWTRL